MSLKNRGIDEITRQGTSEISYHSLSSPRSSSSSYPSSSSDPELSSKNICVQTYLMLQSLSVEEFGGYLKFNHILLFSIGLKFLH